MRVKWNGQTINVENWENKKNSFYSQWNDYSISTVKERLHGWSKDGIDAWYIQCIDPRGSYIYDGYFKNKDGSYGGTLSQVLQDCFDNIGYPLVDVNEGYDE